MIINDYNIICDDDCINYYNQTIMTQHYDNE